MKKITLKRLQSTGDITMYPEVKSADIQKVVGENVEAIFDDSFMRAVLDGLNKRYLTTNPAGIHMLNAAAVRTTFNISQADHAAEEHADYFTQIFADPWNGGYTYHQGDFVTYLNYLYRCKGDNTTGAAPTGTQSSNSYWEYIGADTASLEFILNNRLAAIVDGKVDISIFDTVIDTTAAMRFKGIASLGTVGAPTLLSALVPDIDFTSEDTVKQYMNYFFIVTTGGYVTPDVAAAQHCYGWEAGGYSGTEQLNAGDIIVIQTYTKDSPDLGYYTFGFGVIKSTKVDASVSRAGLVQLTELGAGERRADLADGSSGLNIVDEAALRNVLRDIRIRQVITGLPAGAVLKESNELLGALQDGTSTDDIAFVGSGVEKTVYQWNGATWTSIGTITFPEEAFDNTAAYLIGSTYFTCFNSGLNTFFFTGADPVENDLILELEPVALT